MVELRERGDGAAADGVVGGAEGELPGVSIRERGSPKTVYEAGAGVTSSRFSDQLRLLNRYVIDANARAQAH